jgi:hypothetical protein
MHVGLIYSAGLARYSWRHGVGLLLSAPWRLLLAVDLGSLRYWSTAVVVGTDGSSEE